MTDAGTARVTRDLDLAEECVQEAYAQTLTGWARDGTPDNPAAWLVTTARRKCAGVAGPAALSPAPGRLGVDQPPQEPG